MGKCMIIKALAGQSQILDLRIPSFTEPEVHVKCAASKIIIQSSAFTYQMQLKHCQQLHSSSKM